MDLSTHAIATMLLTVVALILFSREKTPLETSSFLILMLLAFGFTFFPYTNPEGQQLNPIKFFTGFGHEALLAVCGLMIVGEGLVRTGALEPVGRLFSKLWALNPFLSLLGTLVVGATLSAFINNTPIVVLLLPILVSVSVRTNTSTTGILMPMGLATLLGGMTTTIGTSTNLLVVSVAKSSGVDEMGIFDFIVPGSIAALVGILYLWLIAPRILPNRTSAMPDTSPRVFTAHLFIPEESSSVGKALRDVLEVTGNRMKVERIRKPEETFILPFPDVTVKAGDRLLVRDTPANLKEYETLIGAQLYHQGVQVNDANPLTEENQQLAELVIDRGSPMVRRTLRDIKFARTYNIVTLAIHRRGKALEAMPQGIDNVSLKIGDVLLVQGSQENIEEVKQRNQFLVLDGATDLPVTSKATDLPVTSKANLSLMIMGAVILLSAFDIVPIAISALGGSLLMIATNCLNWGDVQRSLSAPVILIVVASLALGYALIQTGATDYMGALMFLMGMLTNVVSNNAAAVIGTPVAIKIAESLGLPAEAFILAVLFGANLSFATPMAYQTNLLVMNAGGYTFGDFVKVGLPLAVIVWLVLSLLLPYMYF